MSQESTSPDLVRLTRQAIDASNRGDIDAIMGLFAPDAVWESLDGIGVFKGATAVRGFLTDWLSSYGAFDTEAEEIANLGGGITFVVVRQSGQLLGAAGRTQQRFAWAITWERRLTVHVLAAMDIETARAAAERLARERG
jgi:ketosteroid isomerase-like protein